jgi:hypothetical protein
MHINFVFDFITCCLLHNLLICCREIDVEQILIMLDEKIVVIIQRQCCNN